jgi:hypothetical protein
MGDKAKILCIASVGVLVLALTAGAQEEQWLQYHSEREAYQIIGDMTMVRPTSVSGKPEDVQLPEFKAAEPYFAKWSTPMAKDGYLWMALDQTSDSGPWDRLYIDSNADGRLDDETPVAAYQTETSYTLFGPVKVVFDTEDGPVSYHLNFRVYVSNGRVRQIYITSGGWYEGEVTVDGQKMYCMLIDYNANGTFSDASRDPSGCDRIRIGQKGTRDTNYVGKYIEVDKTLYQAEISRDGAFVKLAKAEGVKFGNVRVPETIAEFSAGGENGLFTRKPDNGLLSLPVGAYRVNSWSIERTDEKGMKWQLQGRYFQGGGDFEVAEGTETPLQIGEPITTSLSVRQNGDNFEFEKALRGPLGEYVSISRGGQDVRELWKMEGKNEDGTFAKLYPIPDQ